jgi:hypothetical protein
VIFAVILGEVLVRLHKRKKRYVEYNTLMSFGSGVRSLFANQRLQSSQNSHSIPLYRQLTLPFAKSNSHLQKPAPKKKSRASRVVDDSDEDDEVK